MVAILERPQALDQVRGLVNWDAETPVNKPMHQWKRQFHPHIGWPGLR